MNEPSTVHDPMAELEALEARARERTDTDQRIVQLEARLAQLENMQLSNDVEGKMHHTPGGGTVLEIHPATTPSAGGGGGGAAANVRVFFVDLDPVGATASEAEIDLALERAYYDTYPTPTTVTPPLADDTIVIRIGTSPTFVPTYVYTVRTSAFAENGQYVRTFTVDLGVPGTPNVTSFYAVGWAMQGGAAAEVKPFDVISVVDQGNGTSKVRLQPGTVAGKMPTNMFFDLIINNTGWQYVVLNTSGTTSITYATLAIESSQPDVYPVTESVPSPAFKILVAVFYNLSRFQVIRGNLSVVSREAYRIEKPSPIALGEVPFTSWWTWSVTAN